MENAFLSNKPDTLNKSLAGVGQGLHCRRQSLIPRDIVIGYNSRQGAKAIKEEYPDILE